MLLSAQWCAGSRLLMQRGRIAVTRELGTPSKLFVPHLRKSLSPVFIESSINGAMGVDAVRWYTPMTTEEEDKEKARVAHLSAEEKDLELRELNRQLAKLEKLKGINTGELYTWSGRYKALMRDYGFPLFVWYWCCWFSMGVMVYGAIDLGGLDAMMVIAKADNALSQLTGSHWALAEKIDPQLGQIGVTLVLNELLEPIRLPFVVVTLKPAVDFINPPKY